MSVIEIEKKKVTPYMYLDPDRGVLKFEGRSSPDNTLEFYAPVLNCLDSRGITASKILVDFKMEYFNTSSTKCFFSIFRKLGELQEEGREVEINWFAEEDDYDMIEIGEDLEDLTGMKFQFIIE